MNDAPAAIAPEVTPRGRWRWVIVGLGMLAVILVPFFLWEEDFNRLAQTVMAPGGPRTTAALAVVVLLAADVVLPVPSSVLGTGAGALFGVLGGTLVGFAGLTLGVLLGWALGRSAGREAVVRIIGPAELARTEQIAARFGPMALVVARPIPVLAEATVMLAGASGMPLGRCLFPAALANLGLSCAWAIVGAASAGASSFLLVFAGAVVLPGLSVLAVRRLRLPAKSD